MKIYDFVYVKNIRFLFNKNRFVLSALNLSFLAFFISKKIKYSKNFILWPDGIYGSMTLNCKKISGAELINKITIPKNIKHVYIIGNLKKKEKFFLQKKFLGKILHISLPIKKIDQLKKILKFKFFFNSSLCLITLPTPKQEQVAEFLFKKKGINKIICIGGGLAIASSEKMYCPKILYDLKLEWLWRLRIDTSRRIKRLLTTFCIYYYYKMFRKFPEFRFRKI